MRLIVAMLAAVLFAGSVFAEDEVVELTPETKEVFTNLVSLTPR